MINCSIKVKNIGHTGLKHSHAKSCVRVRDQGEMQDLSV